MADNNSTYSRGCEPRERLTEAQVQQLQAQYPEYLYVARGGRFITGKYRYFSPIVGIFVFTFIALTFHDMWINSVLVYVGKIPVRAILPMVFIFIFLMLVMSIRELFQREPKIYIYPEYVAIKSRGGLKKLYYSDIIDWDINYLRTYLQGYQPLEFYPNGLVLVGSEFSITITKHYGSLNWIYAYLIYRSRTGDKYPPYMSASFQQYLNLSQEPWWLYLSEEERQKHASTLLS